MHTARLSVDVSEPSERAWALQVAADVHSRMKTGINLTVYLPCLSVNSVEDRIDVTFRRLRVLL